MSDSRPECFISYSWDTPSHNEWVRKVLAIKLAENGVKVRLDIWDTYLGIDLSQYMESSIRESDYVLLICTPNYAMKADERKGGVGVETTVVTGEFFQKGVRRKFVPLLKEGDAKTSLPSYLGNVLYVDFRQNDEFPDVFESLLRHLYSAPAHVRPNLGPIPSFARENSENIGNPSVGNDVDSLAQLDWTIEEIQGRLHRATSIGINPSSVSAHTRADNISRDARQLSELQDRRVSLISSHEVVRGKLSNYMSGHAMSYSTLAKQIGTGISPETLRRFIRGQGKMNDKIFASLKQFAERQADSRLVNKTYVCDPYGEAYSRPHGGSCPRHPDGTLKPVP